MQLKPVVRRAGRRARLGTVLSAALTRAFMAARDKVSHGYLPYHDRHPHRRRYRRLVVIEIGVGGCEFGSAEQFGASLA